MPLHHDVTWMAISAKRLLDGGTYVSDIYEVNAPLAIFLYGPAALLAKWTGIHLWPMVIAETLILTAFSVLATGVLLRRLYPHDPDSSRSRQGR